MTHSKRLEHLPVILRELKEQTYCCDYCVWNNSEYNIFFDNIRVFRGFNDLNPMQRFVPAIISDYEYIFYCDDDIQVGRQFVEFAISYLSNRNSTILVAGGSLILKPTDDGGFQRDEHWGMSALNNKEILVDIGASGSVFCKSDLLRPVFLVHIPYEIMNTDIAMSVAHHLYNKGDLIIPPHDDVSTRMIENFHPWHSTGRNSAPDFTNTKNGLLRYIMQTTEWAPPSWQRKQ